MPYSWVLGAELSAILHVEAVIFPSERFEGLFGLTRYLG